MSFNITPKAGAPAPGADSSAQGARARAIAALMGGATNQAQATPVPDANAVKPEDMSAITPPSTKEVGQERTSEAAPAETTEPPKEATTDKAEPLSAQYAQLARKEKALRAEALKLKAERDAFKADREAAAKPTTPAVDPSQYIPKDRLTKDTWAVLNELGISYDQLTQAALNAPSPEAQAQQAVISELKAEIKALKDAQDSTKQTFEENQKQSYQQALAQLKRDTQRLIQSEPEAYEAIASTQSVDDVVELIERTWTEEGELLPVEEAARMVEEHLAEEAYKLAQLKKIQKRLAPAPTQQAQPAKTAPAAPQQQSPKTLTNAASATRPMTVRDRAIAAAEGRLNK